MVDQILGCVDAIEEMNCEDPARGKTKQYHIFSDEQAVIASIEADLRWNTRQMTSEELGSAVLEYITDEYTDYEESLSEAYTEYLKWFAGNIMACDWYRSDVGRIVRDTIFRADEQGIMTLETFNQGFNEVWYEHEVKRIQELEEDFENVSLG